VKVIQTRLLFLVSTTATALMIYARANAAAAPSSYSVMDIGKADFPRLTADQRSYVGKIIGRIDPLRRARLRFTISGFEGAAKKQVYVLDPGRANPDGSFPGNIKSDTYQCFKVVGVAQCNLEFNPRYDFVFSATMC